MSLPTDIFENTNKMGIFSVSPSERLVSLEAWYFGASRISEKNYSTARTVLSGEKGMVVS